MCNQRARTVCVDASTLPFSIHFAPWVFIELPSMFKFISISVIHSVTKYQISADTTWNQHPNSTELNSPAQDDVKISCVRTQNWTPGSNTFVILDEWCTLCCTQCANVNELIEEQQTHLEERWDFKTLKNMNMSLIVLLFYRNCSSTGLFLGVMLAGGGCTHTVCLLKMSYWPAWFKLILKVVLTHH